MKAKELRNLPDERLKKMEEELRSRLLMTGKRFVHPKDKLQNLKLLRKEIARIKTILNERNV